MAFAGTFAGRWTDYLENMLGRPTTPTQRANIAAVILPMVRPDIVAAGLNPDALTNAQGAEWALVAAGRINRAEYARLKRNVLLPSAQANAVASVESGVAAALADLN